MGYALVVLAACTPPAPARNAAPAARQRNKSSILAQHARLRSREDHNEGFCYNEVVPANSAPAGKAVPPLSGAERAGHSRAASQHNPDTAIARTAALRPFPCP